VVAHVSASCSSLTTRPIPRKKTAMAQTTNAAATSHAPSPTSSHPQNGSPIPPRFDSSSGGSAPGSRRDITRKGGFVSLLVYAQTFVGGVRAHLGTPFCSAHPDYPSSAVALRAGRRGS
jgi:hypothetical protein